MAEVEAEKKCEEEKVKGGELLFCGSTSWDTVGRKKSGIEGNLYAPTRLRPLVGIDIRFVATGCVSCHCVALDVDGRCYTWGRNEKGQLGHGDMLQRDRPTAISELSKHKIVKAGAGRSHTVVVTDDGQSFAFGWNKHGQLGSGSLRNEVESSPVRCQVSDVTAVSCGGEFTAWLSSAQGASILTAGLPQYGQLGHGTDNEEKERDRVKEVLVLVLDGVGNNFAGGAVGMLVEEQRLILLKEVAMYNTKDSSVRLAYEPQPRPKAIASFSGETIVKVACGTNHSVAVDSNGFVYTWGYGGYGRLGHREQKDEWAPRRLDVFTRHNVLPSDAVVSAGGVSSACTAAGGQLYMWGKMKNTGDDWMYPKPVMDLSGCICVHGFWPMFHFVGADTSCISWGHAQHGELGYGPNGQKSSTIPKKVDILEGMHVSANYHVCSVGCDLLIPWWCSIEQILVTVSISLMFTTERHLEKKSKDVSESEEETDQYSDDGTEDESDGEAENGKMEKQRGGKASGRGRGREARKVQPRLKAVAEVVVALKGRERSLVSELR
ncbi:Protein RCC2-like protein [Bienertia sinuspersici]